MAGPATLFQTGDHSSRPASGAGCVLYNCTDHNLVYVDSGSSWSTLITLASGIADTTFNAKGDILSASADDTPAILSVGTNGDLLRAASGETTGLEWQVNNLAATAAPDADDDTDGGYTVGSMWFDTTNDEVYFCVDNSDGAAVWKQVGSGSGGGIDSGSSFPGGPSTGDLYHRTDLSPALWRYDGTRWRSEQVFYTAFPMTNSFSTVSATANHGRLPVPYLGTFGVYGIGFDWLIAPGGSHDASNYYTCKINWATQADSDTQFGATTLDSKTATTLNNMYSFHGSIDAVLDSTARTLKLRLDKVASAANLTYSSGALSFQLIAT